MSENTSNTTTVKPHFKLWAKKVEANEVTPQHPHKPFPGWVYGVLFVIFDDRTGQLHTGGAGRNAHFERRHDNDVEIRY